MKKGELMKRNKIPSRALGLTPNPSLWARGEDSFFLPACQNGDNVSAQKKTQVSTIRYTGFRTDPQSTMVYLRLGRSHKLIVYRASRIEIQLLLQFALYFRSSEVLIRVAFWANIMSANWLFCAHAWAHYTNMQWQSYNFSSKCARKKMIFSFSRTRITRINTNEFNKNRKNPFPMS